MKCYLDFVNLKLRDTCLNTKLITFTLTWSLDYDYSNVLDILVFVT